MANRNHLAIFNEGSEAWNKWRIENTEIQPNLSRIDLSGGIFYDYNFSTTNFTHTNLTNAKFFNADLRGAVLDRAELVDTYLAGANLIEAKLHGTYLIETDFNAANLEGASLIDATFKGTQLEGADFSEATFGRTIFNDTDLSTATGLDTIFHLLPSDISISTLYRSSGKIPDSFLLGCGVPESLIIQIPALIGAVQPFQYNSCFISFSTKDEDFAKRLHSRLRDAKVRVWFAPEDMKGGKKIHEQIEQAIQVHDRLLLVLSEHSIKSSWVETEIRKAFEVERRENRRKLFPIRLAEFETLQKWKCFDGDSGRDLAAEVREYFIPDFSNWKDHDSFEKGFERLLRDLKDAE